MPNKLLEHRYVVPFVLVTTLFALWGFANDITNPMVAAFQTLLELSAAKASLIQLAFYGGYATMAIPAALFIRRYSYKSGIMLGLLLYAVGAFLFIPAAAQQSFAFFCLSLYILTFGLAFLETTANPFILSLGSKQTSTRRLNLAQAFNPLGSLCGMAVASMVVLPQLLSDRRDAMGAITFHALSAAEKAQIRLHDIALIRNPYVALGAVVLVMLIVISLVRMPKAKQSSEQLNVRATLGRLWHNRVYREGVVTQLFYVAAQIMVWTFIIQYADHLGIDKATAQTYNIGAMTLFLVGRFVSTMLMRVFDSRKMLAVSAACAFLCTLMAICYVGMVGLYSLVLVSLFMSLMFPTIYGVSLEQVEDQDMTLGAAFLVEAIVGGSIMPPLQGAIIDMGEVMGLPAVNASFVLPLLCFLIIFLFGIRAQRQ